MQQLSKSKAILYHLYPGILITLGFIVLGPLSIKYGFSPQFGMLVSILLLAVPLLIAHLRKVKKKEQSVSIAELNGFTKKLPPGKLIMYSVGLVIFAFLIWGITQPLNAMIADKVFGWLPGWFTADMPAGYDPQKLKVTLILNLVLNGFLAPLVEELYFRGYLLPRMRNFGRWAFLVNAVLFSLYHFWQPTIYLTLILSLLPMTWLVWKTKDLRLGILTHSLLNIIGAVLSFAMLVK